MYKIEWDKDTGGVLLSAKVTKETLGIAPRPVWFEELDLLGLDRLGWTYPQTEEPLMWAVNKQYFYRGDLMFEAKGANIYDAPTIVFQSGKETATIKPIDVKEMLRRNSDQMFLIENEAIEFIRDTYMAYSGVNKANALSKANQEVDFEALAEDKRPIVIVVLRDVSSGRILIPSRLVFKYNGTELAFGEDGLCTTEQFVGMFKRVTGYNVSVDSQSYPMTGLRVMKNLVPISGYDNDRITVSGEVEIGGHTVVFNELATDVVIQESSGKQYELFITSDKGTQIINPSEVLTLKASLYSGGDLINDLGNITLQWKKQLPSGEANLGTQGIQNIAANDIDGSLVVSCEAVQNAKVIAKGFITVFDLSDPILAAFKVKGLASDGQIYPGETGTLTPYAYKRQSGEEVAVASWDFATFDGENNPFTLSGKDSNKFQGKDIALTYTDAARAKTFRVIATNTNPIEL